MKKQPPEQKPATRTGPKGQARKVEPVSDYLVRLALRPYLVAGFLCRGVFFVAHAPASGGILGGYPMIEAWMIIIIETFQWNALLI